MILVIRLRWSSTRRATRRGSTRTARGGRRRVGRGRRGGATRRKRRPSRRLYPVLGIHPRPHPVAPTSVHANPCCSAMPTSAPGPGRPAQDPTVAGLPSRPTRPPTFCPRSVTIFPLTPAKKRKAVCSKETPKWRLPARLRRVSPRNRASTSWRVRAGDPW